MRDIKFRAWDKKNKMMLYPNPIKPMITWYDCFVWLQLCHPYQHNYGLERTPDDPKNFEIMQFTGLHDKNGKGKKDAYENDIALCSTSQTQHYKGVVKWESPCYVLDCFWERQDAFGEICREYELYYERGTHKLQLDQESIDEILGNIYDNSELLEKKE